MKSRGTNCDNKHFPTVARRIVVTEFIIQIPVIMVTNVLEKNGFINIIKIFTARIWGVHLQSHVS